MALPDRTASLLVAMGAFGLTATANRVLALVTIPIGMAFVIRALRSERSAAQAAWTEKSILVLVSVFALMSITGPHHLVFGSPPQWLFSLAGLGWLVLGTAWLIAGHRQIVAQVIYTAILVVTAVTGAGLIVAAGEFGLDVFHLHKAAAGAISSGLSPYSEAVMVPNGAPAADPAFIVGYPYPPVTAVAYSIGEWLAGDPRWLSLAAWLATLALIGRASLSDPMDRLSLGVMLLMASVTAWPLVLTAGWTEPLSLLLLTWAVWAWSAPGVAGAVAGLAMGSKQYLAFLGPTLVVARSERRVTRIAAAVVAAVISFIPILLWGVGGFVEAAVRFHLEAAPRTDGKSLVGLLDLFGVSLALPVGLVVVVALAAALFLGSKALDVAGWLAASVAVLVCVFLLSSQAFTNYWFLLMGITGAAISVDYAATSARQTPRVLSRGPY